MISQELQKLNSVIEPQQADLAATVTEADSVRQQLADAKIAIGTAEATVKQAEHGLQEAKNTARQLESAEQRAERKVEEAAKNVAIAIIRDPKIEPVAKTLFSLIYEDRKFAWQEGANAYAGASERARVALTSIMERLQPEAPILYFRDDSVTADTTTNKSLVSKPPKATNKYSDSYVSIEGGSISVVMPETATAKATDQGLVAIEQDTVEAVLISNMYGYDLEHLEAAAKNNKWLIIGREAIVACLQDLEPLQKFVALTALRAVGVELNSRVNPDVKTKTEKNLVELLAFLASGTGQETVTREVTGRDAWTGGSHSSQVTEDTILSRMAKSVDKQSIRQMALTLGLDKESLRAKIAETLDARIAQNTTSLDQLAKDVQSKAVLDSILDSIFN